ncbi:hypothetical protein GGS23DRAFT_376507 [Durotheca rogersii]|uniref:uncharacterized protein n=1 Tax=Durotheca rogersii TaxID=419775 RepID=UPI00221F10C2|nr:uncharacterized protein GGS23DRAFT_376507 [Durotheca rogersii]KAI5866238.1 hypothetical protein GGS23DRAFT_376507 [Durotheca rogersii]
MDYGLHDQHASYILSQSNRGEEDTDLEASWVMLSRAGEIEPLPHETILHRTRGRIALNITALNQPPPDTPPLNIKSESGTAYITNQRLIYLPSKPTDQFKSFSSKILGCQDSRMCSSWIGPWYWEASVRPVPDGNIPPEFPRVNLRLTFKDGGSSEFESKFVELKARLHHAAQIAEESGQSNWAQTVHDEQLPEYSGPQGSNNPNQASDVAQRADEAARQRQAQQSTPDEPPPNYDEAQAQAVSMRFDERMREEAERQ